MNPRSLFPPTTIFWMMVLSPCVVAQTVHTPDLDDGAGWIIVQDDDALAEFGFDYSPFGIPPAPHGQGTTGLRIGLVAGELHCEQRASHADGAGVRHLGIYRMAPPSEVQTPHQTRSW